MFSGVIEILCIPFLQEDGAQCYAQ